MIRRELVLLVLGALAGCVHGPEVPPPERTELPEPALPYYYAAPQPWTVPANCGVEFNADGSIAASYCAVADPPPRRRTRTPAAK